ncbi:DUF3048 domain-containing protein [bacterium]|nr:DUF3048 domain-containing protein [bacterium]
MKISKLKIEKIAKNLKKFLPIISAFFVGILITIFVFQIINIQKNKLNNNKTKKQTTTDNLVNKDQEDIKDEPKKERLIDGVLINEENKEFYPLAITIENNEAARPQSGLDKANLVIEVPVEGGITRFLAFFADGDEVDKIGPIRSARPYFFDWSKEFDALYCHVGGSPEALKILKTDYSVYNLNQYFQSRYYWRSSKQVRPHNVYSSSELLYRAVEDMKLEAKNFDTWKFKDELCLEERNDITEDIIIDFSTYINRVEWRYNLENNEYLRYQAGKQHLTLDENKITAKNIIIQKTNIVSLDNEDRKKIKTIGNGDAIIFLDGKTIKGYWKKLSAKKRTKFYDYDNQEIEFNRGVSWIEVVSKNVDLEY